MVPLGGDAVAGSRRPIVIRANTVTGRIEVQTSGWAAGDRRWEIVTSPDTGAPEVSAVVRPWAAEQTGMGRATEAAGALLGLMVTEWEPSPGGQWQALVTGRTGESDIRAAAAAQLESEVEARMVFPLETLAGSPGLDGEVFGRLRDYVHEAAGTIAMDLAGSDEAAAEAAAFVVPAVLFPGGAEIPVTWWTTPLGRLVAWAVGHPSEAAVSYSVAGAMLGISKVRVQQLADTGKLQRHPGGGVTSASVRKRMHARAELQVLPAGGARCRIGRSRRIYWARPEGAARAGRVFGRGSKRSAWRRGSPAWGVGEVLVVPGPCVRRSGTSARAVVVLRVCRGRIARAWRWRLW
jgi:hypothetical protein